VEQHRPTRMPPIVQSGSGGLHIGLPNHLAESAQTVPVTETPGRVSNDPLGRYLFAHVTAQF